MLNTHRLEKLATRKVTPRPFLILAAWESPKPIHFWKGPSKIRKKWGSENFPPLTGGVGAPWGGDEKFSKYGLQYIKLKVIKNANQWDYLLREWMTLVEAGRGGNAFLGFPGVGTKNAFPSLPASPRVIKFLNNCLLYTSPSPRD